MRSKTNFRHVTQKAKKKSFLVSLNPTATIIIIIITIIIVTIIIIISLSSPSSSSPAGHLPETIVSANNLVNIQGAKARVERRKWTRVHVWTRVSSPRCAKQTLRGRD